MTRKAWLPKKGCKRSERGANNFSRSAAGISPVRMAKRIAYRERRRIEQEEFEKK